MWTGSKRSKESHDSTQYSSFSSRDTPMGPDADYSAPQNYTYVMDPQEKRNKQGLAGQSGSMFSNLFTFSNQKKSEEGKDHGPFMAGMSHYGNAMNYDADVEFQPQYGRKHSDSTNKGRRRAGALNARNHSSNAYNDRTDQHSSPNQGFQVGMHAPNFPQSGNRDNNAAHNVYFGGAQNFHHNGRPALHENGVMGSNFPSFPPVFGGKAKGPMNGRPVPMPMHPMGNHNPAEMHPMNPMYCFGGYPPQYPTMAQYRMPHRSKMQSLLWILLILLVVVLFQSPTRSRQQNAVYNNGGNSTVPSQDSIKPGRKGGKPSPNPPEENSKGVVSSKPVDEGQEPSHKPSSDGNEYRDGVRVLYNTLLTDKFLNDLEAKVMKSIKEKQVNSAFGGKLTTGIEKAILMQLKAESTEEKQGLKEVFVVLRDGSGKNKVFNHKRAVVNVPREWPDLAWEKWPVPTIQILRFVDEHGNDIQLVNADEVYQFEKGLKWLPWNTSPELRKYADWSWTYSDGTEKDF